MFCLSYLTTETSLLNYFIIHIVDIFSNFWTIKSSNHFFFRRNVCERKLTVYTLLVFENVTNICPERVWGLWVRHGLGTGFNLTFILLYKVVRLFCCPNLKISISTELIEKLYIGPCDGSGIISDLSLFDGLKLYFNPLRCSLAESLVLNKLIWVIYN